MAEPIDIYISAESVDIKDRMRSRSCAIRTLKPQVGAHTPYPRQISEFNPVKNTYGVGGADTGIGRKRLVVYTLSARSPKFPSVNVRIRVRVSATLRFHEARVRMKVRAIG